MQRILFIVTLFLLPLPLAAQEVDENRLIVVAEIEDEAIRPLLSPPEVAGLVEPEFEAVWSREQKRPRFEQFWIKRGPEFRLEVDAQFADGNDYLVSLPLEVVQYGEKRLLVLVRERG